MVIKRQEWRRDRRSCRKGKKFVRRDRGGPPDTGTSREVDLTVEDSEVQCLRMSGLRTPVFGTGSWCRGRRERTGSREREREGETEKKDHEEGGSRMLGRGGYSYIPGVPPRKQSEW